MRCRPGLAAAAVALCCTAAACGSRTRPADSAPTTPATLGPPATLRIGLLENLGALGAARAVEDGMRLAVSQYAGTASGTGVDVTVDARTTRGTAAGAAAAARLLVADGVVAVIGPGTATEAAGAAPVLAAAGVATITVTMTDPGESSADWPGLFRMVADDGTQGGDEADEVVDGLGRRAVAVISGTGAADTARAEAASLRVAADGAQLVWAATAAGPASVGPLTARVLATGVDGLLLSLPGPLARALVLSLVAAGYNGSTLVATDAGRSRGVLGPLGADADGTFVASPADDTSVGAVGGGPALVLRDAFQAAYGEVPPPFAAEAYDATDFVLAGVAAGATTPGALTAYLAGHQWAGVTGTVAFGADGNPLVGRVFISEVRDGVPVQVATAT